VNARIVFASEFRPVRGWESFHACQPSEHSLNFTFHWRHVGVRSGLLSRNSMHHGRDDRVGHTASVKVRYVIRVCFELARAGAGPCRTAS